MHRSILVCAFCAILAAATSAVGQLIDFETTPAAATPVDDAALSTPYNLTGGGTVRFFFDRNANDTFDAGIDDDPLFEQINPDGNDGFSSSVNSSVDVAAPGYASQLGTFFLRGVVPGAVPPPFIIDYNTSQTITQLSGEIWDIDGSPPATEQWQVDVLDGSNSTITTQFSPLGISLAMDSLPWTFAFTGLPAGVDKLRLTFVGTKQGGVGLAFNNFSPTEALPEPSSVLLLAVGSIPLMIFARRRANALRQGR